LHFAVAPESFAPALDEGDFVAGFGFVAVGAGAVEEGELAELGEVAEFADGFAPPVPF
jgi:hypothetical protein